MTAHNRILPYKTERLYNPSTRECLLKEIMWVHEKKNNLTRNSEKGGEAKEPLLGPGVEQTPLDQNNKSAKQIYVLF